MKKYALAKLCEDYAEAEEKGTTPGIIQMVLSWGNPKSIIAAIEKMHEAFAAELTWAFQYPSDYATINS